MKSTSKIMLLGAIVGSFCFSGCDSEYSADAPSVAVKTDPMDNQTITGVSASASVTNTDTGLTLKGTTSVKVENGQPSADPTNTLSLSDRINAGGGFSFTPSLSTNLDTGTNTLGIGIGYTGTVNNNPLTVGVQANINLDTHAVTVGPSVSYHF